MKTVLFAIVAMLAGLNIARADQISLNFIDTNDCARAQNEIRLLGGNGVAVNTQCIGPGSFASDNGRVYAYRLLTSVAVDAPLYAGSEVQLNYIDTNDCSFAVSEVNLLNGPNVSVRPVCMGPGYYSSNNGQVYSYRVVTTLTVNY